MRLQPLPGATLAGYALTTERILNGDAQVLTESLAYIRQAASQMLAALTNG